ncbi:hypothetical protein Gorai_005715, partial [Gossypium raimondii]|nr:hypothetical protein [Gossypium raimondii]
DGKSIWVWHDSWIPHIGPLLKVIPSTWSLEPDCYLEDMVTPDGAWNLDLFRIWVLEDIILLLVSIPLPHLDAGSDRISWLPSSKGTSESTFLPLAYPQATPSYQLGTCKERHNLERVRRGIGQDASCPVCGHVVEDTLHVLRDCLAVNEVWEQVVPRSPATGFFNSNLFDWLVSNLQSHKFMVSTEGILDGLTLIRDRGLDRLLIHTDSVEVAESLQTKNSDLSMSVLVRRIHQLLKDNKHWVVSHVPREANQIADQITK